MQKIEIWQPRYKDKTVLIAQYKVPDDDIEITFTKAKYLEGMVFTINGRFIKDNCPLETNGKIPCYAVPFDSLINITKPIEEENFLEEI